MTDNNPAFDGPVPMEANDRSTQRGDQSKGGQQGGKGHETRRQNSGGDNGQHEVQRKKHEAERQSGERPKDKESLPGIRPDKQG